MCDPKKQIIDAHVHMSEKMGIDASYVIKRMEIFGVAKSLVFSDVISECSQLEVKGNAFVLEQCRRFPDILFPYYFYTRTDGSYRYLLQSGDQWRGIKIYPNHMGYFGSIYIDKLIELVNQTKMPLMIHSDSRPGVMDEIVRFIKEINGARICICHAFHLSVPHLNQVCGMHNVYVDISPWVHMMRFAEDSVTDTLLCGSADDSQEHVVFQKIFQKMNGRLLWGTDLMDSAKHSFGSEVAFVRSLPETIRKTMYENTTLFL